MKSESSSELKQFTARPLWYKTRGIAMLIFGGGMATLCIVAPNVYMLGEHFSWLPVIGVIVFLIGFLRCIDAFSSESVQGYLLNMQGGILDIVLGFLVLFGINEEPGNLRLLIVGYLFTQGIFRNILLSAASISNPVSSRITGIISFILGMLIWVDWPTSAPWFLALSLSVDISFRGWALIMLASSLKMELADVDAEI
jgi:uncharacterized membrane protein HdeD (DUF308 family)